MNKNYIYLFATFIFWSTSSAIVVNFKGLFPPFQAASAVTIIATIVIVGYFLLTEPRVIFDIAKIKISSIIRLAGIGFLGLFLYPIFYFYGLHSPWPLEANVINYFWPMIGIFTGFILKIEEIKLKTILGIVFGFAGVIVTTTNLKGLGNDSEIQFHMQFFPAYIFAALGALSYGIYTALIKKINVINKDNHSVTTKTKFVIFLTSSCILHIIYNLSLLANDEIKYSLSGIDTVSVVYLFIYAIFNFSIAYFFWMKALEKLPLSHVTLMAFLIPTLSTMILSYWKHYDLTTPIIYGLLLILIGLYIQQDHKRYITPLIGICIGFVIFGVLDFLIPINNNASDIVNLALILQILIAVFAILSSFVLSRVISQLHQENELFISIENSLVKICYLFDPKSKYVVTIDQFMNQLIETNVQDDSNSYQEQIKVELILHDYIQKIREGIIKLKKKNSLNFSGEEEVIQLEGKITKWRYLKSQHVSAFEWMILTSLVMMSVIITYQVRQNTLLFQFSTIIFACSLVLCLLAIRDYDLRRPRENSQFILFTQQISHILGLPPYIPKDLIENSYYTRKTFPFFGKKYRTKDREGNYVIQEFKTTSNISKVFTFLIVVIVFGFVFYTLLNKY